MQRLMIATMIAFFTLPALGAWSSIATLGTGSEKVSDASVNMTTSAAAEAGNVIIVCVAMDNPDAADGDTDDLSVTDSAGNIYTQIVERENAQGAAAGGAIAGVFYSVVTSQLSSGGTITATIDTTVVAKAVSAWEFSMSVGNAVQVAGTNTAADDGADPTSVSIGSLANQEHLFVHCLAAEGPQTDAYTWDVNYTQFGGDGTTGAAVASNMHVRGGYRILTATSSAVNVTSDTADRDYAQVAGALDEITAAASRRILVVN